VAFHEKRWYSIRNVASGHKFGHPSDIKFKGPIAAQTSKKRKRKQRTITWFLPPFNLDVKTNIGTQFFGLVESHFGKGKLKFLNKNTVKLSYSTMGNVKAIYNSHNKKVLSSKPKTSGVCKCSKTYRGIPKICPIPSICNETDVVYKATVTESPTNIKSIYYGLTMNKLKTRVNAHLGSFAKRSKENQTTISKHVQDIEDRGGGYAVDWTVERRTRHWEGGDHCSLCLAEKTSILFSQEDNVLNQRKELYSKCPHRRSYQFRNTEKSDDEGENHESELEDEDEEVFYDCRGNEEGEARIGESREGDKTGGELVEDSFSVNLFNRLQREKSNRKKAVVKRRIYDDK